MKIVIIEDEQPAAVRLKNLIQQQQPDADFYPVIDSVEGAVQFFNSNQDFDLVFMDVHLSDGNSFEVFRLCDIQKPVVFTTAYDQYALEAFKVYSLDYLLKPIKIDELHNVFRKYRQFYVSSIVTAKSKPDEAALRDRRFLIKAGHKIRVLPYEEVAFYYTRDKLTFAVSHKGDRFPIEHSLDYIAQHITDNNYFRINRQYIVHRNSIQSMSGVSKSRVKLELIYPTGGDVIVSVERSPEFKKWVRR